MRRPATAPGGNSATAGMPSIAGQPKLFMENQLVLFREGIRKSPVMTPLMAGIPDKEIVSSWRSISRSRPVKPSRTARRKLLRDRGRALAKKLRCGICHLSDFSGQKQMPRLAGQREDYLRVRDARLPRQPAAATPPWPRRSTA